MVPFHMCESSDTKALQHCAGFWTDCWVRAGRSLVSQDRISNFSWSAHRTESLFASGRFKWVWSRVFLHHVHSCCLHCMTTFNLHLWMSQWAVLRDTEWVHWSPWQSCRVLMQGCRRAWTSRTSSTDFQPCSVHTDISFDDIMNCRWWHIYNFNIYLLRIRI